MRFVIASTLCLLSTALSAQILNVEKTRIKGDSANYFVGNVGIDFNINNRNLNDQGEGIYFIGLNATSDFGYLSENSSYFLLSQFQYNATSRQEINSTGFGHFRINFLRKEFLSYELFTQIQYDQGRGMQLRWLGGGGVRLRIYEEDKSNLYVGFGIMREHEEWNVPAGIEVPDEDRLVTLSLWKSTNYLNSRVSLNNYISFNSIAYFQTGYDTGIDAFRHRFSLDANVLVKVTSRLSFRTSAGFTYENRPVVPIPKLVYSVTNGVQLGF